MAVSKSTDGGVTWSRTTLTTTTGFTYSLAVDPSNSDIVYAGGDPRLYKSTDAGTSWALSSTGMNGIVHAIAIDPNNSNILCAGTDASIFRSTDAGANWADCGLDTVQAILINPSAPETIYAGTKTGFYQSADSGSSWSAMNTGLENLDITSLGLNPGNYIFCGTRGSGMYSNSLFVGAEEQQASTMNPLLTAYPNPFRAQTIIKFALCTTHYAHKNNLPPTIRIYDATGRMAKSFTVPGTRSLLPTTVTWDGTNDTGERLPAGIYFCRLESEGTFAIEKITLLK